MKFLFSLTFLTLTGLAFSQTPERKPLAERVRERFEKEASQENPETKADAETKAPEPEVAPDSVSPAPEPGTAPAPAPEPTPAPAKSHDPRPYAAPAPTPTPSNTRRRPRSTPSTFLEELDAQPIPSSPSVTTPRPSESSVPVLSERHAIRHEEALPPVKLRPFSEPLPKPQNPDVLDKPLDDDFEGFEAITLKEIPAVPDPKKAAADLRAALES